MKMSMMEDALASATDTKECVVGPGAADGAADMFGRLFPSALNAIVIEDPRTRGVAGGKVVSAFRAAGMDASEYVVNPDGSDFHATYEKVEEVREAIRASGATAVAVGSGTLNDLTKRASDELGQRYMVVGTAASVDGYSSFGAAIRSPEGAKQTYACPAPRAILADLDVMRTAPAWMAASGYADLMANFLT